MTNPCQLTVSLRAADVFPVVASLGTGEVTDLEKKTSNNQSCNQSNWVCFKALSLLHLTKLKLIGAML